MNTQVDPTQGELYTEGLKLWGQGGKAATEKVTVFKNFSAIPIREGDDVDELRGVESLEVGEVVKLRIQGEKEHQNASRIAWMYSRGKFRRGVWTRNEETGAWTGPADPAPSKSPKK